MIRHLFFISFIIAITSCEKSKTDPLNKFVDTEFIRIADFQDRRLGDSLLPYLESTPVGYRRDAALAFASLQDSNYTEALGKLLLNLLRLVKE